MKDTKARNYVAKYAGKVNRAATHANKKQKAKRGQVKHKGRGFDLSISL